MEVKPYFDRLPPIPQEAIRQYAEANGLSNDQVLEYALCFFFNMEASTFDDSKFTPPAKLADEIELLRLKLMRYETNRFDQEQSQ